MTQKTNPELNERRRYRRLRARLLNAAETSTGKNHAEENREKTAVGSSRPGKLGLAAHQEESSIPMTHGSPPLRSSPRAHAPRSPNPTPAEEAASRGDREVQIGDDAYEGKECLLRGAAPWRVRACLACAVLRCASPSPRLASVEAAWRRRVAVAGSAAAGWRALGLLAGVT